MVAGRGSEPGRRFRSVNPVEELTDLHSLADELLLRAAATRVGHSTSTLAVVRGQRQTLLAIVAGKSVTGSAGPGLVTTLGLRGAFVLAGGEPHARQTMLPGMWARLPLPSHAIEAVSDSVMLLTGALSVGRRSCAWRHLGS